MSDTHAATVLVRDEGAVRTITLNRPQALNSFTVPMHQALRAALAQAADTPSVRCVVMTGAGRGFCAGQDLSEVMGEGAPSVGDLVAEHYKPLALQVSRMPVPVIAAVNGVAAGAGANLALSCDLVVAAESAAFVQAFSKIGLVPDCGGTWLLPRLVGRANALGLALIGDKLGAAQAKSLGLIWQCVPDADLVTTVQALAAKLASMPVKALVATRLAMDAAQQMNLEEALSHEGRLQADLAVAHDCREGMAAFLAKRAPVFTDR
ncbi:MAG: 2-(1,2-epoxy-1,2-dihydrophenyl)acetyl-CoA isomerase [Betaproteobacteria bacterium]|nr:2-(1,2-epoxy-1,2-dihydrophenyl)acetyl-CoA isomerase [Betaproteobacteria bacterium]NBU48667.1 2-(1,2-epoxy-1,2-dihydrophenyl)acetyl-CoA isomerase [Betaproteobacteria bacterium]NBX96361.1 2-(1,2-epoxy-1,2-dihydrophenyl)acetyl-CoA isomerase [Betaproteobacteria bacterium]